MKIWGLLVAILFSAWLFNDAFGHHSGAEFDRDILLELEGEVVQVLWRNPHILLTVEVRNDDDAVERWKLEGWPAYGFVNAGVPRDIVTVGDRLQIVGHPSSRRDLFMHVNSLLLANGTEVLLGTNQPHWSTGSVLSRTAALSNEQIINSQERARGIYRVWSRDPGVGFRWDGELPLTDAAISAQREWDPEVDDDVRRCFPPGMPRAMFQNPHPIEFVDEGDRILLRMQEFSATRTIHIDAQTPLDSVPYSRLGYSIGRLEDQSLIVDTSNIEYPLFNRVGIPQSRNVRIRETFTLSDDESRLNYTMELTDANTFTETIVGKKTWRWSPGIELQDYDCTFY